MEVKFAEYKRKSVNATYQKALQKNLQGPTRYIGRFVLFFQTANKNHAHI